MVVPVTPIRAIVVIVIARSDIDTERPHASVQSLCVRRYRGDQCEPRETCQQKLSHLVLHTDLPALLQAIAQTRNAVTTRAVPFGRVFGVRSSAAAIEGRGDGTEGAPDLRCFLIDFRDRNVGEPFVRFLLFAERLVEEGDRFRQPEQLGPGLESSEAKGRVPLGTQPFPCGTLDLS
jgi:hypothetical protein